MTNVEDILRHTIIYNTWAGQTPAQVVCDVLAYVRERHNVDIRPDESLAFFGTEPVEWMSNFLPAYEVIDRMAESSALNWHVTDKGIVTFSRGRDIPPIAQWLLNNRSGGMPSEE